MTQPTARNDNTNRPEEVTEMNTNWITTTTAHDDCDKCLACIDDARLHAGVTGSIGATYRNDERGIGGVEHSATVARIKG